MYPTAYIEFLAYFHGSRDYFECHEVLEEYWKDERGGNKEIVWACLIQIAVSLYHYRRGNWSGAKRMLKNALKMVKKTEDTLKTLALNPCELVKILEHVQKNIEQKQPFHDIELPITDKHLLHLCKEACLKQGSSFGAKSDLTNEQLVHKHALRDREEIISLRLHRLNEKERRRLAD